MVKIEEASERRLGALYKTTDKGERFIEYLGLTLSSIDVTR